MAIRQIYSIEEITQRRLEKKAEIRVSKRRMTSIAQDLFTPQKSKNKMEGLMQHVNTGIAAYDGIMTGFKVLKRVRSFFSKEKTNSSNKLNHI